MKWNIPPVFREHCVSGSFMRSIGTQYHPCYFHIHHALGEGYVFVKEAEPGLLIRNWNYRLSEAVTFHFSGIESGAERTLSLICLQSIPPFRICNGATENIQSDVNELFLYGNTMRGNINLADGAELKIIELLVTEEWFRLQYGSMEEAPLHEAWIALFNENGAKKIQVRNGVFYHTLLNAIAADVHRGAGGSILVKSRALELFDFVLHQLLPEQAFQSADEQMDALKEMLDASIFGKLPAIETMARRFAMSESTLKRRFRKAFGSGIYEYYIKKKMETARALLFSGNLRVSEVAFRLSYEKVSHFIELFTRHHGISPGQLRSRVSGK
ncbi:MAG: helix-turn-helix transcriptional regulator [Chitinophagaceae bacterium]